MNHRWASCEFFVLLVEISHCWERNFSCRDQLCVEMDFIYASKNAQTFAPFLYHVACLKNYREFLPEKKRYKMLSTDSTWLSQFFCLLLPLTWVRLGIIFLFDYDVIKTCFFTQNCSNMCRLHSAALCSVIKDRFFVDSQFHQAQFSLGSCTMKVYLVRRLFADDTNSETRDDSCRSYKFG